MNEARHPGVDSAVTLADVLPGQRFITYTPFKVVIRQGVFTSEPVYSEEDAWTAKANIHDADGITEQTVSLHGIGVTPDYDGTGWGDACTVPFDE